MASKTNKKVVLVESDFLLGLRKGDRNHAYVLKVLDMHKRGSLQLRILSSAVMEVRAVLYSRGLALKQVEDAISLIDSVLNDFKVRIYVAIKLTDVVLSERMRDGFSGLTFFDSLHASASKRLGIPLLSNDPIYKEVGVQAVNFSEL